MKNSLWEHHFAIFQTLEEWAGKDLVHLRYPSCHIDPDRLLRVASEAAEKHSRPSLMREVILLAETLASFVPPQSINGASVVRILEQHYLETG